MKISRDQVRHVATLARLDLTDDEIESLTDDLSSILSYVEKLGELDTDAVEPTANVVAVQATLRDDEVTSVPATDDALANAPSRDDGFFVVPSIIE